MTNPAPRPALRKAPDADVHPARAEHGSAIDLRTRRAADGEPSKLLRTSQAVNPPEPALTRDAEPAAFDLRESPNRGPSKTKPPALDVKAQPKKKSGKKIKAKNKKDVNKKDKSADKAKSAKSKDKFKKAKPPGSKSRAGKRIDLRVEVPTKVRKTLRTTAKARGTSIDGAVDSVIGSFKSK